MTVVLADAWVAGNHGWFLLVPLVWILILFTCFRLFWWRRGPRGPRCAGGGANRRSDPREILAERYARGEITNEEYRERRGNLER
jgi:putative membrane protein